MLVRSGLLRGYSGTGLLREEQEMVSGALRLMFDKISTKSPSTRSGLEDDSKRTRSGLEYDSKRTRSRLEAMSNHSRSCVEAISEVSRPEIATQVGE